MSEGDSLETRILLGESGDGIIGVGPALYQTSLFTFASFTEMLDALTGEEGYVYTRGRNPTVRAFEEKVAVLEGAEDACAFASGMAAITAALLSKVSSGDRIVCVRNVYPDAYKLMTKILPTFGVETRYVDGTSSEAVVEALDGARLLYLENPTSLLFEVLDLPGLIEAAKEHGVATVVDNSWATPLGQRPLDSGADLVLHSASKYLCGHSDVVAGVVAGGREDIRRLRDVELMALGGKLSPFDAWLLVRGLRTLPIRLERHRRSAGRIARFLETQEMVESVNYPGLAGHPRHDLFERSLKGGNGLLSFRLAEESMVEPFVDALRLFRLGVSWGGYESLVYPVLLSHLAGGEGSAVRAFDVPRTLIRLHVGLEEPDDLIADLTHAFAVLTKGEEPMEV